jgi:2-dehydropantoate 2-reductase
MRIAVVGVGGVGGYFGGRLAEAGEDVVFVARGETLAALRERGLFVESVAGDFHLSRVASAADPGEVGPVDAVLLGVKAWQVAGVAPTLRPLLGPETFVVPLQNGIEAPDQLAAALGSGHAVGGVCKILASQAAPGVIRHAGVEPTIAFGELDGSARVRTERLREAFGRAHGVTLERPADIRVAMWEKLLFIVTFGTVGAATRSAAGVFRSLPETRALLVAVAGEVLAVAHARGVPLDEAVVGTTLAYIDALPPHAMSSMQRDLADGRPSELEAQTGSVVRLGRLAGVPTPVSAVLYAALLPGERRARGE